MFLFFSLSLSRPLGSDYVFQESHTHTLYSVRARCVLLSGDVFRYENSFEMTNFYFFRRPRCGVSDIVFGVFTPIFICNGIRR